MKFIRLIKYLFYPTLALISSIVLVLILLVLDGILTNSASISQQALNFNKCVTQIKSMALDKNNSFPEISTTAGAIRYCNGG